MAVSDGIADTVSPILPNPDINLHLTLQIFTFDQFQFTAFIREWCERKGLATDVFPDSESTSDVKLEHLTLTETQRTSVQMFFENGQSVEKVADLRNLKASTIAGHITDALKQGNDLDTISFIL